MNTVFSFGSYYSGNSALHRMDPRTKLLGGVAFIITVLCAKNFIALIPCALFTLMLYLVAKIPFVKAMKSLAPLMAIVVLASLLNLFINQGGAVLFALGPIVISEFGVYQCAFIATRLVIMMMCMSLVTMTTVTLDLTEAVERCLAPFARFGMPAHELGMIMGIALRFLPQFASEFVTIRRAQLSRGANLKSSPIKGVANLTSLIVPLFTSAFRHAETLSLAMDARCYHGKEGRTRMNPLEFGKLDTVAVVLLVVLVIAVILVNIFL